MDDTRRDPPTESSHSNEEDSQHDIIGASSSENRKEDSPFEAITPIAFEPLSTATATTRSSRRSLWLIAIMVTFVLIAAIAWFLFTGRSVAFRVDPVADLIEVGGPAWPVNMGDRWLLRQGEHSVRLTREGYEPLETTIEISAASDQSFNFELVHLPGRLNINAGDLTGGVILINGEQVAELPMVDYTLAAGSYDVQIKAPRYQPYSTAIDLLGGGRSQSFDYELIPNWADVRISSEPLGATLYVGEQPVGDTPLTAEVDSGVQFLELRLDGYKPWLTELDIVANQPQDLGRIALVAADQMLAIRSTPTAVSVRVNGEFQGQTPLDLPVQPDAALRIDFSRAGYRPASRSVTPVANEAAQVSVRLSPILGDVSINGSPADAELFINGVRRGTLNQLISLPSHPQQIEVRKPGFESFSRTVIPNPDSEQRVLVSLVSDADRAKAATPDVLTLKNGQVLSLIRPSNVITMGSNRRDQGRRSNEMLYQVQLQRPFYMARTEVTNQQYLGFNPSHDSGVYEQSTLSLDDQPVVRVDWQQAARYCNWLSQQHGLPAAFEEINGSLKPVSPMTTGYRLPTEAEWVFMTAYQGGALASPIKYPWGNSMPPTQGSGNYAGAEAEKGVRPLPGFQDSHPAVAPVGSYPAGPRAMMDLGGNVREWMHSAYAIAPGTRGQILLDPMGAASGQGHVVRGSSWRDAGITPLRVAYRQQQTDPSDDTGFRVVRYAE